MFVHLYLNNFKAWRDVYINLAPITMLLGSNSTGKSSLLQSILLLKQTAASPDRTVHLNLGGDEINDYFSFGSFNDVLIKDAEERTFSIDVGISESGYHKFDFMVGYAKNSAGAPVVDHIHIHIYGSQSDKHFSLFRREKGTYSIEVDEKFRGKSRDYAPERSIAFSAEAIAALGLDGSVVQDISLALRRELENISYLGPLRRRPERDYFWNKSRPGDLGSDGVATVNALLASSILSKRVRDSEDEDLVAGVSKWLNAMGVAERLEVRQVGRSTRYEILIHRDGIVANLRDVGIGISQVLPVLTLAYFAPRGSSILLEEPEIHLHPLAQSKLADLFVEVSRERQVQFIVETHSEHLFRRLQTLIAKNTLSQEDCALYFVERDGADAVLRTLEIDEFGAVKNWPDKFFGDAMGEAREQAQARAKKMAAVKNNA